MQSTHSSISSFSGPSASTSGGGRRSRLSNSLFAGGGKSTGVSVAGATPTSRKHYNSNPSRSFDDSFAPLSGRTTPSENGAGSGPSSSSMSTSSQRRVYVSDQELCFRANQVHDSLDFDALTNLTINTWAWEENHREFALFAMDSAAERRHEVLAAGDINCSIEELISILHLATVSEYNATMKRLLKKDFIYGSIVHTIGPESPQAPAMTPRALDACSSSSVSGGSVPSSSASSSPNSMGNYVAVKTSMFVRSNMFARNEEWCFLESFERSPEGDNFLLTQSTIDAAELGAGKASHSRVDQLRDVTTAFYVEKIPRTRGAVRLFFHGKYDGGFNSYINTKGVVPPKAVKSRLMALAKGVSRISDLVRRRRLGLQKMANHTAFNMVKNTRCTCCTKGLHMFTKKKRCFLCAYYVCDKCWSQQKMETCNGKTSSILICTRCLECVDTCQYSDVCSQDRKKHLICVEPDGDGGRGGCRDKDGQLTGEPAGKALVDILEQSLGDSNELIKSAAMSVIRHILKQDSFGDLNNEESYYATTNYYSHTSKPSATTRPSMMIRDDGLQSERDHVEALAKCFELEQPTPLRECVLANADSRNYPIHVPENPARTVPDYPVPENESQRLLRIQENNFLSLGEVAELNIICSLAAEELHCAISMITVIDEESELILACNNLDLHRTKMPRNQTFCSHLIMDNKPLLIRNPEADVRFHNMDAVTKSGVRFYCGFPVVAQDGTVVGSVCCLDFEQRSLTQSQYSMMQTLAKTASKVLQAKGRSLSGRRTMGGASPP